jgi:hypothetical protein
MGSVESAAGRAAAPSPIDVGRLVAVPAAATLAVTVVRLVGELQGWSSTLFSRAAGGGLAVVGISWLIPVFGAWFGWSLARRGARPAGVGRAIGFTVAALAAVPVAGLLAARGGLGQEDLRMLYVFAAASLAGVALALRAWPLLGRVLLAYGLAARLPVALVMLAAMLGNWGTHYDVEPPGLPALSVWAKWLAIGLLPQLTIWIWFTVAIGMLFGLVAGALGRRRGAAA